MSQECSVAVLNDCTEISINNISVKDLCHYRPSPISIENETILSGNTDISTSQVFGNKSFLERVRSLDLATLFPRGSLNNQKRKKKKKTTNVSTSSVSLSSESTSSFNKTDNIEENSVSVISENYSVADSIDLSDESGQNCKQPLNRNNKKAVSVSLASMSGETYSIIDEDKSLNIETTKAFDKKLYLKKKSVNVSFDSVTSEKSLTENTLAVKKNKNKVINVCFDLESPRSINLAEGNKSELDEVNDDSMSASNLASTSPLVRGFDKKLTVGQQPSVGHSLSQKSNNENTSRILTRNLRKRNLSNLDSPVQLKKRDVPRRSLKKLITKNKLEKRVSVHFDFNSSEQSCDKTFNNTLNKNNDITFVDNNKTDAENISMELDSRVENDTMVEEKTKVKANVTTVSNTSMELEFMPDDDKETPNNKSAKLSNKNFHLKKKLVNVPFDLAASLSVSNVLKSPIKKAEEIKDSTNELLVQGNSESGAQENIVEAKVLDDFLSDGEAVSQKMKLIGTDISKKTPDTAGSDFPSAQLIRSARSILKSSGEETIIKQGRAFNKNMYLKKKSINFSFNLDEMSITNSDVSASDKIDSSNKISENSNTNDKSKNAEIDTQENISGEVKKHGQIDIRESDVLQPTTGTIDSNLSYAQLNSNHSLIPMNDDDKLYHEEETKIKPNKPFNKDIYLKKKSVNVTFTLGDSEMSCTDDNLNDCVKTINETEFSKTKCSVKEMDQENTNIEENEKSISDNYLQKQIVESRAVEGDNLKADKEVSQEIKIIQSDPSQLSSSNITSKLSSVQLNNENNGIPINNEESTMKESPSDTKSEIDDIHKEERDKVFNKKLYLKKKSVNVSFSLGDSEISCTDDNLNDCVETINETEFSKTKCAVKEMDQENTNIEENEKSISDNYLQKQIVESRAVEGDNLKADKEVSQEMKIIQSDPSQLSSSNITSKLSSVQLNNENNGIPINNEESTMKESPSDTKSEIDDIHKEERDKVFNKKLYLKKKSVNVSFSLGDSEISCTDDNLNDCVETINETEFSKTKCAVKEMDQENTNIEENEKSISDNYLQKQIVESRAVEGDNLKADKEVSQEMKIIQSDPSQLSSSNITSKLSSVQLNNENNGIPINNEESTMKESPSDTKSEIDDIHKEERDKVFNKKLYLKKKSVNVSFSLGYSEISCTDDNLNDCVETINETEFSKTKCAVKELDQENTNIEENEKSISDNYLQKQIVESRAVEGDNLKADKEVSQEMKIIQSNPSQLSSSNITSKLSSVQLNNENNGIPINNEESTMKESPSDTKSEIDDIHKEERDKVFNKKLYLKKKSVNVSFSLGDSEILCTDDNLNDCVETINETEFSKTKCSVKELDQKNTNIEENEKSVSDSYLQKQIVESRAVEGDNLKADKEVSQEMKLIQSDSFQLSSSYIISKLSSVQLNNENNCIPINNEESTKKESPSDTKSVIDNINKEERDKVFNKKLYLKKKSVNVTFTLGDSEMSCTDDNVNDCVKTINETEFSKTKCFVKVMDQENTNIGENKKSISDSYLQKQIVESRAVEGDNLIADEEVSQEMKIIQSDSSQLSSSSITSKLSSVQLNNENNGIPINNEESIMKESPSDTKSEIDDINKEERDKVFNKKLYLKKKSVNVTFTLGDSEMSCTDDNVNDCVETINETEFSKTKCSVKEMDQENTNNGENEKTFSDSASVEHIVEVDSVDDNLKANDNATSQPIRTETHQTVPNGSNLFFPSVITGEETQVEAINKNLDFKKKSFGISFDFVKSDSSTKEAIQLVPNQITNTYNILLSPEKINVTQKDKLELDMKNDISNSNSASPEGGFNEKNTVEKHPTDDPLQSVNSNKKNVTRLSEKSNESNKTIGSACSALLQESLNLRRSQRNSKTNNKFSKKISNSNTTSPDGGFNEKIAVEKHPINDPLQSENSNKKNVKRPSKKSNQSDKSVDLACSALLQESVNLRQSQRNSKTNNKFSKKISNSNTTSPDGGFNEKIAVEKHPINDPLQSENSNKKNVKRPSKKSNQSDKSVDLACSALLQESVNLRRSQRNSKTNDKFSKNVSVHLDDSSPIKSFNNSLNNGINGNILKMGPGINNISTKLDSRFENDLPSEEKKEINTNVNLINLSNSSMQLNSKLEIMHDEINSLESLNGNQFLKLEIDLEGGSFDGIIDHEIKKKMDSQETIDNENRKSVDNCFYNTATENSVPSCIVNEPESDSFPSLLQNKNESYKEKVTPISHQNNLEEPLALPIQSRNPCNDLVDNGQNSISETDQNDNVHFNMETLNGMNSNEIELSINLFDQSNIKKSEGNKLVSINEENIIAEVAEDHRKFPHEVVAHKIDLVRSIISKPVSVNISSELSSSQLNGEECGNSINDKDSSKKGSSTEKKNVAEPREQKSAAESFKTVTETNNYKLASISVESSNDVATHSHSADKSGDNEFSRGDINKNKSLKVSKMGSTNNRRNTPSAKRSKRRSVTFATTARMKTDSQSGEIKLNPSFGYVSNSSGSPVNAEVDKRSETVMNTQMSIGLSIIRKDNENLSDSPKIKEVCHSTPIEKHQRDKNVAQIKLTTDKNSEQEHIFACPDITARNLRKRTSFQSSEKNKRDTSHDLDNSGNLTKKSKLSYYSWIATDDSINDISIIPNMNNRAQKKIHHSTPISNTNAKRKKSNERLKKSISAKDSDNDQVQHNDKMIQVSKTIFGSSTEGTGVTVSKKQSIDSNASSNKVEVSSRTRSKRKSVGDSPASKKAKEMLSSAESRSYHSNFVSSFESGSRYCTQKKVTFKNVSKSQNVSTTDYRSSTSESSYYITRNSKKVGFREAISLIDETTGDYVRDDLNNSDFNIELVAKDLSNNQSNLEKELTNMEERPSASLNYTAEEPEIIIEENEIGGSIEMSTECSLFKKVKAISKSKKEDKKTATKNIELTKTRQKKLKSSDYEAEVVEKWVSKGLIKFLNNKLNDDDLEYVVKTERVVSILCSAVNAVKHLKNVDDIDAALSPLKNILVNFNVCSNMIEYSTFISKFTPFEFQLKALSLGGYFGSIERHSEAKLTDPFVHVN